MSRVRVVDAESLGWRAVRRDVDPSEATQDDLVDVGHDFDQRCHRVHHEGSETELDMFEVKMPPNDSIGVHAHEADEIVVVVEGELKLGARTLGPGGSIMIPGWTLYGLHAGPDGARFLNFRSCKDRTYMSKEQFLERRATRSANT